MPKKHSMADDIVNAVTVATHKWTKTIKKEERNPSTRRYRYERMTREARVQFKEAAWEIMEQAYNQASGNSKHTPATTHTTRYIPCTVQIFLGI